MMAAHSSYVALAEAHELAGSIVYWRLEGSLDAERLSVAWAAQNLDPELLPSAPTSATALHRALRGLGEKRRLVRPLEGHKGWALVDERANGDELAYFVELRAYVNGGDQIVVTPQEHPEASELRAAYARHLREVSQADVGGWLCRMIAKVEAVALRDTGGVYFVPRHGLDTWNKMTAAINAASAHVVFGIPAMKADETVAAVVDAVTNEAEKECLLLEAEVMREQVGERALLTRMERVNQAEAKLARYEVILGKRLENVAERLNQARAAVSAAILTASAPKQPDLFK
jgi:hypothetical protein